MAERVKTRREFTQNVNMEATYNLDLKNPMDASLAGAQIRFNKSAESAQDIVNAAAMTSALKIKDPSAQGPQVIRVDEIYVMSKKGAADVKTENPDMVTKFENAGYSLVGVETREVMG
tara:strand:+ start:103 stop:456 length:354 start_codon:yes stop_codon:yes gene_type:complete